MIPVAEEQFVIGGADGERVIEIPLTILAAQAIDYDPLDMLQTVIRIDRDEDIGEAEAEEEDNRWLLKREVHSDSAARSPIACPSRARPHSGSAVPGSRSLTRFDKAESD